MDFKYTSRRAPGPGFNSGSLGDLAVPGREGVNFPGERTEATAQPTTIGAGAMAGLLEIALAEDGSRNLSALAGTLVADMGREPALQELIVSSLSGMVDSLEKGRLDMEQVLRVTSSFPIECAREVWTRLLRHAGKREWGEDRNTLSFKSLIETAVRLVPYYADKIADILELGSPRQQRTACQVLGLFCDRIKERHWDVLQALSNLSWEQANSIVTALDHCLDSSERERHPRVEYIRSFFVALRDSGVGRHPALLFKT